MHYQRIIKLPVMCLTSHSRADYTGMCDLLLDANFTHCFISSSIEHVWSYLKDLIFKTMDLFIPILRVKPRNHPRWFSSKIRQTLKCICTLRRKCSSCSTSANLFKLCSLELKLDHLISEAKLQFEKNLSLQNSAKVFK